jgi:hypothetical protein
MRARRNRERAWLPFRQALDGWFDGWRPAARTLAIVGPSGGYCLPLGLVSRFERLLCFEPDPIARFILARRLKRLPGARSVTWIASDAWIEPLLRGGAPPLTLLTHDCALLFSNILGQLTFLVPDARWTEYASAFRARVWPVLERIPWASFHDRLSGPIAPRVESAATSGQRLDDAQLLALYGNEQAGELLDHRSQELVPRGARYGYFHWPLIDVQHHLIEAVVGGPCAG